MRRGSRARTQDIGLSRTSLVVTLPTFVALVPCAFSFQLAMDRAPVETVDAGVIEFGRLIRPQASGHV